MDHYFKAGKSATPPDGSLRHRYGGKRAGLQLTRGAAEPPEKALVCKQFRPVAQVKRAQAATKYIADKNTQSEKNPPMLPSGGLICSYRDCVSALALTDRLDLASRRANEQLAWTANLVFRVADHFIELGHPADGAGQREDGGEKRHRNAESPEN